MPMIIDLEALEQARRAHIPVGCDLRPDEDGPLVPYPIELEEDEDARESRPVCLSDTPRVAVKAERGRPRKNRYRGVSWSSRAGKWQVTVTLPGRRKKFAGYFDDEEHAARVYDRRAVEFLGPSAKLNFPEPPTAEPEPQETSMEELIHRNGTAGPPTPTVAPVAPFTEPPAPESAKSGRKNPSSRYRGVTLHKQSGRWRAVIVTTTGVKTIGAYRDEEEAARAYDRKARELLGDRARLNFPGEAPGITTPEEICDGEKGVRGDRRGPARLGHEPGPEGAREHIGRDRHAGPEALPDRAGASHQPEELDPPEDRREAAEGDGQQPGLQGRPERPRPVVTPHPDPEVAAMGALAAVLAGLDRAAVVRVLGWAGARYGHNGNS